MAWPNPNEYVEAIQHPQQAFGDAALRAGKVVTNRLGLPRPISGNFATVFEVQDGETRWAVRCFLREVTTQQQRYAAISDHLKLHALPFMVNFEYQPEGIRVRGKWYPILKMDWSSGVRLDTYLEQHLDDALKLRQLAERWVSLCRSLHAAQIAHGDLQHGNILVNDRDEIKLIDYDGMVIPDVIGLGSSEIGHRHYQHPTRESNKGITRDNFAAIDNFSEQVIGVSLLALSLDSSLWSKTLAGEENLLFRDTDFRAPDKSAVFALLADHGDARVRALGDAMREAIRAPGYLDVPPFERSPMDSRGDTPMAHLRDWLRERMAAGLPLTIPAPPPLDLSKTSWVFDHLEVPKPAQLDFSDEFILHERIVAELQFEESVLHSASFLLPAYALARFLLNYRHYGVVAEKAELTRACREVEKDLLEAKATRKLLSRLIVEADRRYLQEVRRLEATIAQIADELNASQQQQTREIARLERALQNTTLNLADERLQPGRVPGIDAAQIDALAQVGIRSAADLTAANETVALHALNSIQHGSPRYDWDRLLEWRGLLEQRVSPILPEDVEGVRVRYAQQHSNLQMQQKAAERELQTLQATSEDLQLTKQLHDQLKAAETEVTRLQAEFNQAQAELERYELITVRRFLLRILALPPL